MEGPPGHAMDNTLRQYGKAHGRAMGTWLETKEKEMDEHISAEEQALKKNVLSRMKRIEGQVRGIQGMIESGKECQDILVQVRAVRSALQSANKLILKRYLLRCYAESVENGRDAKESLDKFISVVTGFIEG
jgi:DNA-binding FrmR family transcriptional regulator